eukprot:TRINITY_DN5599_c0_g1_i1.p1 TRINITY_DN5599_c0_g1~~TRINITY_DN5599_c0_g1_i1.p1  ORF type:complete len:391 (-),score=60.62 TRINITY_DN5599_c0_g1_i1:57-1169(-)
MEFGTMSSNCTDLSGGRFCGVSSGGSRDLSGDVQEYYGSTISKTSDLKTNACCVASSTLSKKQKHVLSLVHDDIIAKFYGCGSPIPPLEEGLTVLDLGCGTGRDSFISSAFVGELGKVIGVDMTQSQLDTAKKYLEYHAQQFGFSNSNCDFKLGVIEDLLSAGIQDDTIDVVISNCVLNLCEDKSKVLAEIWRVLKPGGELYFSDVYVNRRIPVYLQKDKTLWGECLSGALYNEDFRRIMERVGFVDFRKVEEAPITVGDKDLERQLEGYRFTSKTIRAFKLSNLEDRCEDFGQFATYKGNAGDEEDNQFVLDDVHKFPKDLSVRVCGNTADMLTFTRYGKYFDVTKRGDHLGLFHCSPSDTTCTSDSCC